MMKVVKTAENSPVYSNMTIKILTYMRILPRKTHEYQENVNSPIQPISRGGVHFCRFVVVDVPNASMFRTF